MSAHAQTIDQAPKGRIYARRALILGLASLPLFVAGFGWVPFAELAAIGTATGSFLYGAFALRKPRGSGATAMVTIGLAFSLLTVLSFVYLIIAFTISPGD